MTIDISLVICTRNRATRLTSALSYLEKLRCSCAWEVIVVDNGSNDNTREVLDKFKLSFPGSMTIDSEPNIGVSRARNAGWLLAQGKYIAFTDDDCYPTTDFLEAMRVCLSESPTIGFVGGMVTLHDPADYPITIQTHPERIDFAPGQFIRAGIIHGANFGFRREALEQVGGFDAAIGAGTPFPFEDVDILHRILLAGWRGAYDPRPVVAHHHGRQTQKQVSDLRAIYDRGRGAYYRKFLSVPGARKTTARAWLSAMRWQKLSRTLSELRAAYAYSRYIRNERRR